MKHTAIRPHTLLLALVMLSVAFAFFLPGNAVWATPGQSPLRRTVPTLTPTPIPGWHWVGASGNPVDYAPSGMPDLDQKQGDWKGASGAWTYSGPVALANVLWWMDSRQEKGVAGPPVRADSVSAVTAYGDWDDHDARNVAPLVNALADLIDTDGQRTGQLIVGTDPSNLEPGLKAHLLGQGAASRYSLTVIDAPDLPELLHAVDAGDGVVLVLGFWEDQGDRWAYLGGHYVSLAGIDAQNRLVAISDPLRDAYEAGKVAEGRCPASHSFPHDGASHNNVRYVSHDAYSVVQDGSGVWTLPGYSDAGNMEAALGQNIDRRYIDDVAGYSGAAIVARIHSALVVKDGYQVYLPCTLRLAQ